MRWTHVKRKRPEVVAEGATFTEEPAPIRMELLAPQQPLRSKVLDVEELLVSLPRQLSHEQLARLLWSSDYWPIFVRVLTQFKDVSEPTVAPLHARCPPFGLCCGARTDEGPARP